MQSAALSGKMGLIIGHRGIGELYHWAWLYSGLLTLYILALGTLPIEQGNISRLFPLDRIQDYCTGGPFSLYTWV